MLGYHATRLRRSGFSSLLHHSLEEKPVLTQTLKSCPDTKRAMSEFFSSL
jgi:hypothetical protein